MEEWRAAPLFSPVVRYPTPSLSRSLSLRGLSEKDVKRDVYPRQARRVSAPRLLLSLLICVASTPLYVPEGSQPTVRDCCDSQRTSRPCSLGRWNLNFYVREES